MADLDWRVEAQTPHGTSNLMNQRSRKLAILNLVPQLVGIVRIKNLVEVSQHGSQSQSHRCIPYRTQLKNWAMSFFTSVGHQKLVVLALVTARREIRTRNF